MCVVMILCGLYWIPFGPAEQNLCDAIFDMLIFVS